MGEESPKISQFFDIPENGLNFYLRVLQSSDYETGQIINMGWQ